MLYHAAVSINNVFNRSVLFWYYKHCNVHLKHIKSNTHVLCAISIMKLCHVILWYCSLESPVLSQEITKVRESVPHVGLLSNVIHLNLFQTWQLARCASTFWKDLSCFALFRLKAKKNFQRFGGVIGRRSSLSIYRM